jgi:tripartite-type tricarboxylate transporter receptor subunit TctC
MAVGLLLGAPLALSAATASAGNYPERPVHVIVPKAPAGPVDVIARLVGSKLEKAWGKPVVIENRGGAGGTIGSTAAARSAPDGYTLLFTDITSQVTAPLLVEPRPYDNVHDFDPVALVVRTLMVLVVNADLPIKSVKDLVAYSKAHEGRMNFSTAGAGGWAHLTIQTFLNQAGLKMEHIIYRGGSPALLAVASGVVHMGVTDLASAKPLQDAGKIRIIAQIGPKRSPQLPDLPTVTEAGIPNVEGAYWVGLLAPKGTPREIIEKINKGVNEALKSPEIVERARTFGVDLIGGTPESFAEVLAADEKRWSAVIKENHITKQQ